MQPMFILLIATLAAVGWPCRGMEKALGLYRLKLLRFGGQIMGELTRLLYQEVPLLSGGLKAAPCL